MILKVDYDKRLGYCEPAGGKKKITESLGSILFGDQIFTSPLQIFMLNSETCQFLCSHKFSAEQFMFTKERIKESYVLNWFFDGLPAGRVKFDELSKEEFYSKGFEIGTYQGEDDIYFNNHYDITIE